MADDLKRFSAELDGLLAGAHRQVQIVEGMKRFVDWVASTQETIERHAGHFAPPPLEAPPIQTPEQSQPLPHQMGPDEMQAFRSEVFRRDGT